jgi:hypothetical protein
LVIAECYSMPSLSCALMRARKRHLPKLPQHLLSALKTLPSAAKLR